MTASRFMVFSGHNDRAVIALCRFFDKARLPFVIVAAGQDDAIHRTRWRGHVIFNRLDKVVTVEWLYCLAQSQDGNLVYCPTTEFINDFVLMHRETLQRCGWYIGLPDKHIYDALTGKLSSQALMTGISPELHVPAAQSDGQWHAPCVLKPRSNVSHGKVLYPLLCRTDSELDHALTGLDRAAYFAQDFVTGQSHYLCGYLARSGRHAAFWQVNLIQQPGGKSIVLAKACDNPGLDEARLFAGLHAMGYHGAFMLEVIQAQGRLYYIEVNPRFWGPLQLALDVCPEILRLFAQDQGFEVPALPAMTMAEAAYAWTFGARQQDCVVHPAGQALTPAQRDQLLTTHDVYAREDSRALHACH